MFKSTITPANESIAALAAIRSLKMGKRRSYAERVQTTKPALSDIVIAMPLGTVPFWATAQAN